MNKDDQSPDDETIHRSRRLKQYEAEAKVIDQVETGDAGPMDLYSPFGPLLAKLQAPSDLVDRVNKYADGLIAEHDNRADIPEAEKPLGEFGLVQDFVFAGGKNSLAVRTEGWIRQYLAAVEGREVGRIRFEMFWIVRHFDGSFSPVHFHSGDISGILYLDIPDAIANLAEEERRNYITARKAGYITFLIGGKQPLSKSLISFKPEVGDFYIFPGWLLHAVEPFHGEGGRRALAFNAFIE